MLLLKEMAKLNFYTKEWTIFVYISFDNRKNINFINNNYLRSIKDLCCEMKSLEIDECSTFKQTLDSTMRSLNDIDAKILDILDEVTTRDRKYYKIIKNILEGTSEIDMQKQTTYLTKLSKYFNFKDPEFEKIHQNFMKIDTMKNNSTLIDDQYTNNLKNIINYFINLLKNFLEYKIKLLNFLEYDESIFNQYQSTEYLMQIKHLVPKNLKFPFGTEYNDLYNNLTIKRFSTNSENLILEIAIPLLMVNTYQLYKLYSIPNYNHSTSYLWPESDYIALDETNRIYQYFSNQELDSCLLMNQNNKYICRQIKPLNSLKNNSDCIIYLLLGLKLNYSSCNLKTLESNESSWNFISNNRWLFYVNTESTSIQIVCGEQSKELHLRPNLPGLVDLDLNCEIHTPLTILKPTIGSNNNVKEYFISTMTDFDISISSDNNLNLKENTNGNITTSKLVLAFLLLIIGLIILSFTIIVLLFKWKRKKLVITPVKKGNE